MNLFMVFPKALSLGPIKFTRFLLSFLRKYNIKYHLYADDAQLYCSFDVKSLKDVLALIRDYISDFRL